jgi:hypothetical protein
MTTIGLVYARRKFTVKWLGILDWFEQQRDVKPVEHFGNDFVFELKRGR